MTTAAAKEWDRPDGSPMVHGLGNPSGIPAADRLVRCRKFIPRMVKETVRHSTSVVLCGPSGAVLDLRIPASSILRTFYA
jgi:hypothetical protein